MGRYSYGHSIIELCCALGISAIITAASLPTLSAAAGSRALERQAQLLLIDLRAIPTRARAEESDIELIIAAAGYQLQRAGSPPHLLRRVALERGLTLRTGSNQAPIVFRRSGTATPRSFQLRRGDAVCTFSISLRGRVRFLCGEER